MNKKVPHVPITFVGPTSVVCEPPEDMLQSRSILGFSYQGKHVKTPEDDS